MSEIMSLSGLQFVLLSWCCLWPSFCSNGFILLSVYLLTCHML